MKLGVNFSDVELVRWSSSSVHSQTDKVREAVELRQIWYANHLAAPCYMACLVVLALAMPRHPPKVHLGNRKWWAISDGTVGTTARVREVLLLTLICWQSVHSWSLVSVPRSVLLKIDQLEFTPLESYKIKNSGWYGENRWLWLFLSSLINVMSTKK